MRSGKIWLGLAVLIGAGVCSVALVRTKSAAKVERQAAVVGRDLLAGTDPREADVSLLEQMEWADLMPTLETIGRDLSARKRIIAETAGSTRVQLRYLRGLLLIASGETAAAAPVFAGIPVAEIPPGLLYAPFRLFQSAGSPAENPYREPMRRAVAAGQTSAVVAARVLGAEGNLAGALQAFLRSDPEQWATSDLGLLEALRWHSGFSGETIMMLKAALKTGRVSETLRPPLLALVTQDGERAARERLQVRVGELLRPSSPLRATFLAAAERQLQLRERFLRRDYAGVAAGYRTAEVSGLPDETLLLLVLSSAQLQTSGDFDRWSRELKRRFPDPAVASWVRTLQPLPVL